MRVVSPLAGKLCLIINSIKGVQSGHKGFVTNREVPAGMHSDSAPVDQRSTKLSSSTKLIWGLGVKVVGEGRKGTTPWAPESARSALVIGDVALFAAKLPSHSLTRSTCQHQ